MAGSATGVKKQRRRLPVRSLASLYVCMSTHLDVKVVEFKHEMGHPIIPSPRFRGRVLLDPRPKRGGRPLRAGLPPLLPRCRLEKLRHDP